jgi:hypothetical protein
MVIRKMTGALENKRKDRPIKAENRNEPTIFFRILLPELPVFADNA